MSLYYETITVPDLPLSQWTVRHILEERARTHAESVFLDVPGANLTYTYAQTADLSFRVASGLLDRGHIPGDRFVIMMSNCAANILAWLGSAAAGLVEVPINTAYHGAFLEHQLRTVAPTAIATSVEFADRFINIQGACDPAVRFYVTGDDIGQTSDTVARLTLMGFNAEPFSDLVTTPARDMLPDLRAHGLASIFFTSGTTGPSKGVMMSGAQMFFFACEGMSVVKLTDADTYMSVGPLFHGNAQILAAYPSLIAGARFVLRERFSASSWIQWIRESGATVTNLIGVMTDFIWKQPRQVDDSLNSLRCISAVPTPMSLMNDWIDRFGPVEFVENFGMTEISLPILTPYGVARPPGAAGLLARDWFDVQLVDPETDEEVAVGDVGELVVRPKLPWIICSGYFGMPDRSAEALRNCWFHTGDALRRDQDGWYYFVDRLKDCIRRRGENISSYEVEQALLKHPQVFECAVVGVPADQEAGEDEVLVFIVGDSTLSADSVWAFSERHLPRFAVPRYLQFIGALPKTPSDKIQKVTLREIGVTASTHDREKKA